MSAVAVFDLLDLVIQDGSTQFQKHVRSREYRVSNSAGAWLSTDVVELQQQVVNNRWCDLKWCLWDHKETEEEETSCWLWWNKSKTDVVIRRRTMLVEEKKRIDRLLLMLLEERNNLVSWLESLSGRKLMVLHVSNISYLYQTLYWQVIKIPRYLLGSIAILQGDMHWTLEII